MLLFETLHDVLRSLDELGHRAALLGGLAVSLWTTPRFTSDVDLAVAVDSDERAEHLIFQLRQRGFQSFATIEQESTGRLATVRMIPPNKNQDEIIVDLLFSSSGIEPEIVRDAEYLDIGQGNSVPVALPGYLVALKLLSHHPERRPQDGIDLRALRSILDESQRALARHACDLITQRGYHRRKNLSEDLTKLLLPR